jgi:upstream activation factor subunit UAF30
MPEGKENRGSGVSLDDPYRLAATHPVLGVALQKMLISRIYGEQDKHWFDNGRVYHPNHICEQTIRLPSGQIRKVFFDESALDDNLPIPEDLRPALERAAANMRVPDTQLVSRFPLVEVKARTAAEAGKIIVTHLKKAEEQGWVRGKGYPFVDDWRNDYELTRGGEKTIMSFDMRPALLADSKLNLIMFSALESLEAVDTLAGRMEAMKKSPQNVIEPPKRLLPVSSWFAGIAAAFAAIAGFFLFHSLSGALLSALIGFGVVLAWSRLMYDAAEEREQAEASLDSIVRPDAILAAVVEPESRKRSELTKALWSYISQHGLQDKNDPKLIHADQKLLQVFGGKQSVTMFELVKLVSKHLK